MYKWVLDSLMLSLTVLIVTHFCSVDLEIKHLKYTISLCFYSILTHCHFSFYILVTFGFGERGHYYAVSYYCLILFQIGPLRCWPGGLCLSRSIGDMDVGEFIVPVPYVKQVKVCLFLNCLMLTDVDSNCSLLSFTPETPFAVSWSAHDESIS